MTATQIDFRTSFKCFPRCYIDKKYLCHKWINVGLTVMCVMLFLFIILFVLQENVTPEPEVQRLPVSLHVPSAAQFDTGSNPCSSWFSCTDDKNNKDCQCMVSCVNTNAEYLDNEIEKTVPKVDCLQVTLGIKNIRFYNQQLKPNWLTLLLPLTELTIENCEFNTVIESPFKSETFASLSKLIIINTNLLRVDRNMLAGLDQLTYLSIQQQNTNYLNFEEDLLADLKNLAIVQMHYAISNEKDLINLTGTSSLPQLREIDFRFNKLSSIPANAFKTPWLIKLHLTSNLLKSIEDEAFPELDHLVLIKLDDNKLDQLPEKIFHGAKCLEITLSKNQLKCDCHLAWLKKMSVLDWNNIICSSGEKISESKLSCDMSSTAEHTTTGTVSRDSSISTGTISVSPPIGTITTQTESTTSPATVSLTPETSSSLSTVSLTPTSTSSTEIKEEASPITSTTMYSSTGSTNRPGTQTKPNIGSTSTTNSDDDTKSTSSTIFTTTVSTTTTKQENFIDLVKLTCTDVGNTFLIEKMRVVEAPLRNKSATIWIKEELGGSLQVVINGATKDHFLFWLNSNDPENCGCYVNFKNLLLITNFRRDNNYIFCLIAHDEVTVSPLDCTSFKISPQEEDKLWLANRHKWPVISGAVCTVILTIFVTVVLVFCFVRQNPKLLRGNKRIVIVKNSSADVLVMPKNVSKSYSQRSKSTLRVGSQTQRIVEEYPSKKDAAYMSPISQRYAKVRSRPPLLRSWSELSDRTTVASYVAALEPRDTWMKSSGKKRCTIEQCFEEPPPLPPPRNRNSYVEYISELFKDDKD